MKTANWKNIVWIAIVLLVLGAIWYNQHETEDGVKQESVQSVTVADVRSELVSEINSALRDPNDPIRKFVEDAHVTVDITSANVLKCEIDTIDGSSNAGRNWENIAQIKLTIRLYWDGVFHKGGKTDFQVVYAADGTLVSAGIVQTDAVVNTEDPDFSCA